MSSDVWYRWQFLFSSENKFKNKLINRLEELERTGEWRNEKNYGIKDAFKRASDMYIKIQRIQDVGKITINFKDKNIIIWVKQSFYYEIDVCVPVENKDVTVENILKDFDKTDFINFIKDNILLDLQENVILESILLNFYKYESKVAAGNIMVGVPIEKLLNAGLSKIPADYTTISKIMNTHLFFAREYKDLKPLLFIQFHDIPTYCVEAEGGSDIVHDILSLHLASELLKKEKNLLFEIQFKINEANKKIYAVIEDTIRSKENIVNLKDGFLNVLTLKKNLSERDELISEIIRTTRRVMEIFGGVDETIIQGGGIIKPFYTNIEKSNEDINFWMKKLYKNLSSLEQITLEAISTETLSGIQKSISVQEQISGILKSTHSMHVGILILEIVIFAEIFIKFIEIYLEYHEVSETVRFELVIFALLLGVVCSILLTRFITRNKILERLLK